MLHIIHKNTRNYLKLSLRVAFVDKMKPNVSQQTLGHLTTHESICIQTC